MKFGFRFGIVLGVFLFILFGAGCDETAGVTIAPTGKKGPAKQDFASETLQAEDSGQELKQAKDIATEPAEAGTPEIVLEKDAHDFGEIDPGSKNKGEFKFTNEGDGILKIKKIQSTCGCTVPQLEKKTYLPGESGIIKLTYRSGQRSGTVRKKLYILSNDAKNPKLPFYIKAKITKKISYKPTHLNLRYNKENAGAKNIKIKSLDKKPFAISRIKVRPECMKFDFDPVVEGTDFLLEPQVMMEKLKGVKNGSVTISLTHPSQKSISIGFSVLPPFKADPATIIALNSEPGKPVRKVLYILSNYGEDLEVESVEASNDIIQIVSQQKQRDKYVITLDIVAPEKIEKTHFNSKLIVKIVGADPLEISCIGSIKKKT